MNNRFVQSFKSNQHGYNNQLLANNPMSSGSNRRNRLQEINQQKKIQELKLLERRDALEKKYGKQKIFDSIIKPEKLDKVNNKNVHQDYKQKQHDFEGQKEILWKGRTNKPYKRIIKDENNTNYFQQKTHVSKKDEKDQLRRKMIIHRVTDADKEGVEEELIILKGKLQSHDDNLRNKFSEDKKAQHIKKFEYHHRDRYIIPKENGTHEDNKEEAIKLYKKQQEEEEANRNKADNIIAELMDVGFLDNNKIPETPTNNKIVDNQTKKGKSFIGSETNDNKQIRPHVSHNGYVRNSSNRPSNVNKSNVRNMKNTNPVPTVKKSTMTSVNSKKRITQVRPSSNNKNTANVRNNSKKRSFVV